jgi:hypothetical protein
MRQYERLLDPADPASLVQCKRRATYEVFNTYNASLGYHCAVCAKRRLAELLRGRC